MARIRTIKPDFWTDEKIVELSDTASLLFIGLWNFADDSGRMEYSPVRIKLQILPTRDVDCVSLLTELATVKLVRIYEVDGKKYLQVNNFDKHQKIDKRSPSKFPPPPPISPESPRIPPKSPDGMEGKRKGMEKDSLGAFDAFWKLYPKTRAGSPDNALAAWKKALTKSTEKEIMDGLQAYIGSDEVARGFAKGAAAWLNDERWKSDYKPAGVKPAAKREMKANVLTI